MALSDHIMPSEEVQFSTDETFKYGGDEYHVYVTNDRFILYMERGLVRSKDDVQSWNLENIEKTDFEERGTVRKKGVLRLEMSNNRAIDLKGGAEDTKTVYQNMMQFIQ
ncbi:hypothetical protein [Haloferax sulfurifontis]|nr:hypothetical protein [Haloferax sulfurifontis]